MSGQTPGYPPAKTHTVFRARRARRSVAARLDGRARAIRFSTRSTQGAFIPLLRICGAEYEMSGRAGQARRTGGVRLFFLSFSKGSSQGGAKRKGAGRTSLKSGIVLSSFEKIRRGFPRCLRLGFRCKKIDRRRDNPYICTGENSPEGSEYFEGLPGVRLSGRWPGRGRKIFNTI